MPSHKIHVYIEEKLNDKLKLNEDLFKLGNVLPDLIVGRHSAAHYKKSKIEYDYDCFINKYKNELLRKNPIILGYLTHLIADDYYNTYIRNNYMVFNEDNIPCGIKKNNKIIEMGRSKIFDIKHSDLENYDNYLIINNNLKEFSIKDYKLDNFDIEKDVIKNYIVKYNFDIKNKNIIEKEYIFLDKEELNEILKTCIIYIEDFLDKLFLKLK